MKNLKISLLYDFYGSVLSETQKKVIEMYYNEDLSLAEIAEHAGISRQGVRDSIIRAEEHLLLLEEKLGLYEDVLKIKPDIIIEDMMAAAHSLTEKIDGNREKMVVYLHTGWGIRSILLYRGTLLRGKTGGWTGNIGWLMMNERLEKSIRQQGWTENTGQTIAQAVAALLHLMQPDVMVIENYMPTTVGAPEMYLRQQLPQLMKPENGEIIPEIVSIGGEESQAQIGLAMILRERWLKGLLC